MSDLNSPRRSLRVRNPRPPMMNTAKASSESKGSSDDSHDDASYEPDRKRRRTKQFSSESDDAPGTQPVQSAPLPSKSRLRQEFPDDDPEMTPIAPQARRPVVRPSARNRPEDASFAALRKPPQPANTDASSWNSPSFTIKDRGAAAGVGGSTTRTSARERVHEAQAARQAEMEANLAWAGPAAAQVSGSLDDTDEELYEASTLPRQRPVGNRGSGRRKLESLRSGPARGARDGRGTAAARTQPTTDDQTVDQLREARELRQAEAAAKQAWASFHARQAAGGAVASGGGVAIAPTEEPISEPTQPSSMQPAEAVDLTSTENRRPSVSKEPHSIASWLGLAPKEAQIPDPVTCEAAQLVDRDSLFVCYVYPLESARSDEVATVLNHLNRRVQSRVPVELLPPALRAAPPSKRGASHDMYALRVLQLRPGRTGDKGAADYSVVEETEDDGEQWGAQKVLNAMREIGVVDAICIVSRWYGGVLLGPVRFAHIHQVATRALQAFQIQEQVKPVVDRLIELDNELVSMRSQLARLKGNLLPTPIPAVASDKYTHVQSLEQAQKLLAARQAALRAQTRVVEQARTRANADTDAPN